MTLCSKCEPRWASFSDAYTPGKTCHRCGRTLGGIRDGVIYFEGKYENLEFKHETKERTVDLFKECLDRVQKLHEDRCAHLDVISSQIKQMEAILRQLTDEDDIYILPHGEDLSWNDGRLRYTSRDNSGFPKIEHRPLIECPSTVRMRMKDHIPMFFKQILDRAEIPSMEKNYEV